MKIKRSVLIPALLLIYLALMASIGWKQYAARQMSATYYFGTIIVTLAVITLLHFSLKRRERLRSMREEDIRKNNQNNLNK